MKRGKPIKRKTALRRSRALNAKRSLEAGKPIKRKRLSADERRRRDEVRTAVFKRDGYRCLFAGVHGAGPCFGQLTFHHRRKASQGGEYSVANGGSLCVHHNDELEADADLAVLGRSLGLVLLAGDPWTPLPARRHHA